jgi:hypothetical protein
VCHVFGDSLQLKVSFWNYCRSSYKMT